MSLLDCSEHIEKSRTKVKRLRAVFFVCTLSPRERPYILLFPASSSLLGAERADLRAVTARCGDDLLNQAACDALPAIGGIDLRMRNDPASVRVFDLCKSDVFFGGIIRMCG